jgi:hypothetical protein
VLKSPKYNIFTAGIHWETPLNTDFGIKNGQDYKIGMGGYLWEGKWRRWRRGNMVDGLRIHIWNRTMKPLAIALSGVGRELGEEEW